MTATIYRLDDYRPRPPVLMPWDWWILGLMVWSAPFGPFCPSRRAA